jgi:hypothetical protein
MSADQRMDLRRGSDAVLRETAKVHRILLDLLNGKEGNFRGALAHFQRLGVDLGRRQEDRELSDVLAQGLQGIARRLLELGIIDQVPRRIRLTKVLGKADGKFPVGTLKLGWEMDLPKVGQRYCLYLDDGRVFRTGEVVEHGRDHFRTTNSVYRLELMDDKGRLTDPPM